MAVIQISRIQQRRGQTKQTGFPQLASGEFGWSIDTQELYIGNGSVAEGAPAVGNTRLITENDSNFFLLADKGYTYKNGAVAKAIPRTIQDKLDDIVNLNDFIDPNSTVGDSTAFIQNAVSYSAGIRKPLYIPEGTYLVTGTVFIPPYAEIRGAGKNKTIISAASTTSILQTIDGIGNQFPSLTSGDSTPQDVKISGIGFVQTATGGLTMISLDCLADSIIEDCTFIGAESTSTQAPAIRFRSQGSLSCDNISIRDCVFDSLRNGISGNYDATNINISNNKFKNLQYGIRFNFNLTFNAGSLIGPDRVTIQNNQFDNIDQNGIFVGSNTTAVSVITSLNNSFINVGNGYKNPQGDLSQKVAVIYFGNYGCASTDDNFSRLNTLRLTTLTNFTSFSPVVFGPANVQVKNNIPVPLSTGTTARLFAWSRSDYTIGRLSSSGQTINIPYTLYKPSQSIVRSGILEIAYRGSTATIVDNFNLNGIADGNVTFSVDMATTSSLAIIGANNSGAAGVITFTANIRQ